MSFMRAEDHKRLITFKPLESRFHYLPHSINFADAGDIPKHNAPKSERCSKRKKNVVIQIYGNELHFGHLLPSPCLWDFSIFARCHFYLTETKCLMALSTALSCLCWYFHSLIISFSSSSCLACSFMSFCLLRDGCFFVSGS